jgi:hypothetical protein
MKPKTVAIMDTDMLRTCFGGEAGHYPDADEWARRHAIFIQLGLKDNGRPLMVPG